MRSMCEADNLTRLDIHTMEDLLKDYYIQSVIKEGVKTIRNSFFLRLLPSFTTLYLNSFYFKAL